MSVNMELDRRKQLQAKMKARAKAAALITSPRKDTQHVKKKRTTCCSCCSWLNFGYASFIVILSLGLSLMIVGGVFSRNEVLILGGVFIIGSFVFLAVVCAPGRRCICCGPDNRVTNGVNEVITQREDETDAPVKKLERTGKRLSFLRGAFMNAAHEAKSQRSASVTQVQKFDRSWVKKVESQTRYNEKRSTIEEESKTTTVSDAQSELKDKREFVRRTLNSPTEESQEQITSNIEKYEFTNGNHDSGGTQNSSYMTKVSIEPHVHFSDQTETPSYNVTAETKEVIDSSSDKTNQEIHEMSERTENETVIKERKKKKRKKKHKLTGETSVFNNKAYDNDEIDDHNDRIVVNLERHDSYFLQSTA